MLNKWMLPLLALSLIMLGCGSKKKIVDSGTRAKTDQVVIGGGVTINNLDFYTFSGKAKTKVELGKEKMDATLHLRIDKNKAIWASITATVLNFEVVRILITPDSVKVLDKYHSVYYQKPFSFLQQYTGEGVDFLLLQDLLLGNVNKGFLRTDKLTVAQADSETQVIGMRDRLFFQYGLNEDSRASSFLLSTDSEGESLQALYTSFSSILGYSFAMSQTFLLRTEGRVVQASMLYQGVDFNGVVEMPFTVPTKYKVVD